MKQGFTRRSVLVGGAAAGAAATIGLPQARAQGAWPNRPITLICPWAAGGGTDATARIVAALLEKDLGQPVNVVNRTGGSGVVGPRGDRRRAARRLHARHHHRRDHDDALAGPHRAQADSYTPLALMNEDPPGVQVNAGSPYKTVKELADAIKAAPPGKLKASGTGQGGIWHLALVGWLHGDGPQARPCRLGALQRRRAGHAGPGRRRPRPRHLLGARSARHDRGRQGPQPRRHGRRAQPAFKDVPTLKEAMGIDYTTGAWRGIAGPQGPAGRHRRAAHGGAQEGQRRPRSSATSWPTAASA